MKKELAQIENVKVGFFDGYQGVHLYFDFGGHGQGQTFPMENEVIKGLIKAVGTDFIHELTGKEVYVIKRESDDQIVGIESPPYRRNTIPFLWKPFLDKGDKLN